MKRNRVAASCQGSPKVHRAAIPRWEFVVGYTSVERGRARDGETQKEREWDSEIRRGECLERFPDVAIKYATGPRRGCLAGPTTRVRVAWLRAPDFSWTRERGSSFPHHQSAAKKSICGDVTTFLDVQGQRLTTLLFTFYSPLKIDLLLLGAYYLILVLCNEPLPCEYLCERRKDTRDPAFCCWQMLTNSIMCLLCINRHR